MKLEIWGDRRHYSASGEYEPGIDPPLKPCPHCGSTDLEISNTHTPSYTVTCACGAEMHGHSTEGGPIKTRKACAEKHQAAAWIAIEAWNLRDGVSPQDEIITWIDADLILPESDETVLLEMPEATDEPVWPGYHDGDVWRLANGTPAPKVRRWAEFPKGLGKREGAANVA
jgi:hypothetical protein